MNLRCKDGDIAIITWDYQDCMENLGRMVEVRGPMSYLDGQAQWRIRPVTPELYAVLEFDRTISRESVTWGSRVTHPDAWMLPIRPKSDPDAEAIQRSKPQLDAEPVTNRKTELSIEGLSQSHHTSSGD